MGSIAGWGALLFTALAAMPISLKAQVQAGRDAPGQEKCLLLYIAKPGGAISGPTPPWRRPIYEQALLKGGSGDVVAAVPYEGFRFLQWNDGSSVNPRRDINITKDTKIEAEFALYTPVPSAVQYLGFGFARHESRTIEIGIVGKTSTVTWEEIIDDTTLGRNDIAMGDGEATRNLIGASGPKALTPPVIDETEDNHDGTVVIKGWFFGPTPRVWREFTVPGVGDGLPQTVRQFLTVLPPDDTFKDIEGKNAYQDPATGESKVVVIIPDPPANGKPKGDLVLDNGVGNDSDKDPTVESIEPSKREGSPKKR
jgi:hypothetical protein